MQFHRFEHVNQICQDLDETRKFYHTLFPNWEVRAKGQEDGWHWMHFGDRQFYLALNQPADPSEFTKSTGHLDHIGFVIDDSEAMTALLDEKGIKYYTFKSPETKCRIYVSDPDGTELELVEYEDNYALK
jgi:catechol 2,3-dioxygenase-like lactoylglutathione lyase family enzyme